MGSKLTLSNMADLIIIITFFSLGFSAFLYLFIDSVHDVAGWIRAIRKARKERKAQKQKAPEPAEAQVRTDGAAD